MKTLQSRRIIKLDPSSILNMSVGQFETYVQRKIKEYGGRVTFDARQVPHVDSAFEYLDFLIFTTIEAENARVRVRLNRRFVDRYKMLSGEYLHGSDRKGYHLPTEKQRKKQ